MFSRAMAIRSCGYALLFLSASCTWFAVSPASAAPPRFAGHAPSVEQLQDFAARGDASNGGGVVSFEELRQGRSQSSPRVLRPQSRPYGLSYNDWSVRWWQWAYGLPVAGHPLFDETGADCAAGQSGPVWFLGGVFNVSGTATRDLCTVPAGKALYFPIINVEWDNICPPTDPPMSVDELAATSAWFMSLATNLQCDVDGESIQNVAAYRFAADPFAVQMPSGNIWEAFGCSTPAGSYYPLVPEGYFIMLAPLSPGQHTVHFRGTIGDPVNFTLEITYHLTVVPDSQFQTADLSSGKSAPTDPDVVPAGRRTSWGRVKAFYR